MIRMPDGRLVHSEVFAYISDALSEVDSSIESFRVRHRGAERFVVQLVAGRELDAGTVETLRGLVGRALGESVELAVEQVPELPRDPSGKLRYFVADEPSSAAGEEER
jgi:hypothetical protein